jgi:small-conductance mechanosensitive channel
VETQDRWSECGLVDERDNVEQYSLAAWCGRYQLGDCGAKVIITIDAAARPKEAGSGWLLALPLEWIIILGLRYYPILLIICLCFLFYLYADLTIVKLLIIGVTISFAWLIKKGVLLDLKDLSKRIQSLEEKYKDLKD